MMIKDILFIIDETELKYFEFNDLVTDFWLIKEFLKRGYKVYTAVKSDLFIENFKGCISAYNAYIKGNGIFYHKEKNKYKINDFDVVFFRSDPPVDTNYINACHVFDFVDRQKTLVINNPCGVKNFNEKLHINYFPEFVPENIVASSSDLIMDFINEKEEAVLKPLNRCFGSGVYYMNKHDKNLLTIISSMTDEGKTPVMVQKYIPEAKDGDKRVLIIGGAVLDECIKKLPGNNNFKFSIHSDKYFKSEALTCGDKYIAEKVAEKLSAGGIYLAGLDVINGKIIEINVTSPCYFIREINQHYKIHFEEKIMNCLEQLFENHFSKERVYALNR